MRLLAPAAALLAAPVLALGACSGGELPPAPTAAPEAPPAAEAPSGHAPAAIATPEAASTPEPPAEVACANGVAVEEPENRPGLVADCVALLASRDALRGEAPLDWGGDLAIGRWEGVAVGGEPPRVTGLDLRGKGLTGAIPRGLGGLTELTDLRLAGNRLTGAIPGLSGTNLSRLDLRGNRLGGPVPEWLGGMERLSALILADNALTGGIPRSIGRLRLDEVRLAGNALTGCVPSAFGDARGDAAYLGLPWCLRYDRLDATGEVTTAGGWAILGADGAVIAKWEGLRSEAATLRVHQTDAGGTSWAAEFGAVAEGDLFEWRKASDCWVRYHVTGPPVRPAAGSGRWEFPVEWMTYAATGEGCTGAVGSAAVLDVDEEPLVLASHVTTTPSFVPATPVRHGPWFMHHVDWTDRSVFEGWHRPVPRKSALGGVQGDPDGILSRPAPLFTRSLPEARTMQFWRDPALPPGVTFQHAESGLETSTDYGYCAHYTNLNYNLEVCIYFLRYRPTYRPTYHREIIHEARVIDGLPALIQYSPMGPHYGPYFSSAALIFDPGSGLVYSVRSLHARSKVEETIEIARSLLPSADTP